MKCYELHGTTGKLCKNTTCRHWIELEESSNCTILAAQSGPKTLQKIGDIFGITRMRICQIEKKILNKIRPNLTGMI